MNAEHLQQGRDQYSNCRKPEQHNPADPVLAEVGLNQRHRADGNQHRNQKNALTTKTVPNASSSASGLPQRIAVKVLPHAGRLTENWHFRG
jgi:hypothetical protein